MDLCTHLSNKVLELESEVIDIKFTYKERIEKLEGGVDRLEEENKVLKELHSVHSKVDTIALVVENEKSFKQGRIIADIDEDLGNMSHHKDIYDDPSFTKKVFANMERVGTGFSRVVTPLFDNMLVPAAKKVGLIQDDVQSISIPTEPSTSKPFKKHKPKKQQTQAPKVPPLEPSPKHMLPSPSNDPLPSAIKVNVPRRRRGVVIQDLEEITSTVVVHSEVQSKDKGKEKEVEVEGHKSKGESLEKEITKKQKMDKEAEELKSHLQIVSNDDDDDDVYTEATPLASKLPIIDYKIHLEETNLTSR
uniref:Uncharacterized protein n=1 Tax=Tanacetum cinerariifolium TaxID=118510 RepID=A0A6L2K5A0_TANCI|nr:hypothetical protein [Tanacetum cinerariifolium]